MPFSGRCGPLLLTRIVFFSHSCYTERDSLCGREENILIERLCRWSVPAFLLLEGALYLSFLALDLLSPGPLSTALKYAALLLCLLMALAGASRGGDRLVAAALAMTARPTSSCWCWTAGTSWASSSFTGSKVAYMVRICKANGGHALLIPRFLLFSLLLVALYQLELFTPETAAAALYFSHFLFNALLSLSLRTPGAASSPWDCSSTSWCDMLVAVSQFPSLFPPPLSSVAQVGMWLFYLPGRCSSSCPVWSSLREVSLMKQSKILCQVLLAVLTACLVLLLLWWRSPPSAALSITALIALWAGPLPA